jgi:hypothetical protein
LVFCCVIFKKMFVIVSTLSTQFYSYSTLLFLFRSLKVMLFDEKCDQLIAFKPFQVAEQSDQLIVVLANGKIFGNNEDVFVHHLEKYFIK